MAAIHQLRKRGAFSGREMRAAKRHQIHLFVAQIELAPQAGEVPRADGDMIGLGRGRQIGLGGDARDMQHRRGRGRAIGGAKCLEIIFRRRGVFETPDQRNTVRCGLTHEPAEHRPEGIVGARRAHHVDDPARRAVALEIDTHLRGAAGQGDAEIHEIRVLHGARAKHAVGIDHRVAFGPGDILARGGAIGQQIGRAGKARACPHLDIGIGQLRGGRPECRIDALRAPVGMVDRNRVHRGRHPHPPAFVRHRAGEGQEGGACVDAAVDVNAAHVGQARRALRRGHGGDDLHRELRGRSVFSREEGAVEYGQFEGVGRSRGFERPDMPPGFQMRGGDLGLGFTGKRVIFGGRQAQHGNRVAEEPPRDQRAERQDILALAEDQRTRRRSGEGQAQQHATSGAGPAAGRHHHDVPGQRPAMLRVVGIDDLACRGVHAAPDAETLLADEKRAVNRCRDDQCRHESPRRLPKNRHSAQFAHGVIAGTDFGILFVMDGLLMLHSPWKYA